VRRLFALCLVIFLGLGMVCVNECSGPTHRIEARRK